MKYDYITFRSITFAQRGEKWLGQNGISCRLKRTPKNLAERGCGYCLLVREQDAMTAIQLLLEQDIPYGKLVPVPQWETGEDKGK